MVSIELDTGVSVVGSESRYNVCTYSILNSYKLMEDYRNNQIVTVSCDECNDGEAQ